MNPLDDYVEQEVREEVPTYPFERSRVEIESVFTQVIDPQLESQVQLLLKPFLDEDILFVEYTQDSKEI